MDKGGSGVRLSAWQTREPVLNVKGSRDAVVGSNRALVVVQQPAPRRIRLASRAQPLRIGLRCDRQVA